MREPDKRRRTAAYLQMLKAAVEESPLRHAVSESRDVNAGTVLPEIFGYTQSGESAVDFFEVQENLWCGKIIVADEREYTELWRMMWSVKELVRMEVGDLMEWLAERANVLPPKRADVLLVLVLDDCSFDDRSEAFRVEAKEAWQIMSRGRNPLYRLFALREARAFAGDTEDLLDIYARALHEKNAVFHLAAIHGLDVLPDSQERTRIVQEYINRAVKADATVPPDVDLQEMARGLIGVRAQRDEHEAK